jgi:ATP-binding cassette subfamily F protein 3
VLVSHDRHLLRNTVDELVLVHDGRADMYGDDLAGYEQWVLGTCQTQDKASKAPPAESRKKQRQEAAANRDRLRPLKQALQKTEAEMAQTEQRLESVQQRLSDTTLYDEGCKEELADLLREEGELQRRSGELDERWLEQQQALEQLV